jgi:hypothetical protein
MLQNRAKGKRRTGLSRLSWVLRCLKGDRCKVKAISQDESRVWIKLHVASSGVLTEPNERATISSKLAPQDLDDFCLKIFSRTELRGGRWCKSKDGTRTLTHSCMHAPPNVRTCIHMHTHINVLVCRCTRKYTNVHASAHAYTHVHARTRVHAWAPPRAHMHMHTHARSTRIHAFKVHIFRTLYTHTRF